MAKSKIVRRRGRPNLGDQAMSVVLPIRWPTPLMREIEAEQALHLDRPDKGALIRQLVVEGLKARQAKRDRVR